MLKRLLICTLAFAWPTLASAALTKAQFQAAVEGAMNDRQMKNQTVQGEQLTLTEVQGDFPLGVWTVSVINACLLPGGDNSTSNNYGKMMRIQLDLAIGNMADGFVFAVNTKPVSSHQKDKVEKALAERLKTLNGDLGISATATPKDGGVYQVMGTLGGSPNAGQVRDKVAKLISNVRFMICDVYNAMEAADLGQWKALKGGQLNSLDKAQFTALYHHFKDSAYERQGQAPHGTWHMAIAKKNNCRIENWGDRMVIWVWVAPPSAPSAEQVKLIEAKLAALPPMDGATTVEASFSAPEFWIGQTYPYADLTGKRLVEIIDDFSDGDGMDFKKKAIKVVESAY